MGRNIDLKARAESFRRRLYRSADGKLLGVFSGIAESLGYPVCRTRWIGVAILAVLAAKLGANGFWVTLMVGGFFYMLAALLMQPPRAAGVHLTAANEEEDFLPPPVPPTNRWASYPSEPPPVPVSPTGRVDLAQLDRQLEGLNRRIQRMETIVTDRQYDWERRLDS